MNESLVEIKREMFELMQRMRHERFQPPSPDGLTQAEGRIVVAIAEMSCGKEKVRPGRVAEFTHTTPSALSQSFRSLEEKGLIERHRSGDDFRAVSVSLTPAGEALAAKGKALFDEHMNRVMSFVGEEDMGHLVRVLQKIVDFHEKEALIARDQKDSDDTCV